MSTVMCQGWKWFVDTLPVVGIKQHGGRRRRIPSSQFDDDQSHTDGNQDDKTNTNAH